VQLFIDYIDIERTKEVKEILDKIKRKYHKFHTCDLTILTKTEADLFCSKKKKKSHIYIEPNTHLILTCCDLKEVLIDYRLTPVQIDGRPVFALPLAAKSYVPMLQRGGKYQIIALIAKGLKNLKKGEYQIDIYQEDLTGKMEGGVNFIIRKR
jgi:hypothetical protein